MNRYSDQALTDKFSALFPSRETAVTFGCPNPDPALWKYHTEPRAYTSHDVRQHLRGAKSIVAIPIRRDSSCWWGAIDVDGENHAGVSDPDYEALRTAARARGLFAERSKRHGAHLFAFFDRPYPAAVLRRTLHRIAVELGYGDCEVFPKQDSLTDAGRGNGINLPFFGRAQALAEFEVERAEIETTAHELPPALPASPGSKFNPPPAEGDAEPGLWDDDALRAMLEAFRQNVPGFYFRPCRGGYAVPCPGETSWPDGVRHSAPGRATLPDTIVFIRNGWPCLVCLHAHCRGDIGGIEKKTFADLWQAFDPLRLWFDFEQWWDEDLRRRGFLFDTIGGAR